MKIKIEPTEQIRNNIIRLRIWDRELDCFMYEFEFNSLDDGIDITTFCNGSNIGEYYAVYRNCKDIKLLFDQLKQYHQKKDTQNDIRLINIKYNPSSRISNITEIINIIRTLK